MHFRQLLLAGDFIHSQIINHMQGIVFEYAKLHTENQRQSYKYLACVIFCYPFVLYYRILVNPQFHCFLYVFVAFLGTLFHNASSQCSIAMKRLLFK